MSPATGHINRVLGEETDILETCYVLLEML